MKKVWLAIFIAFFLVTASVVLPVSNAMAFSVLADDQKKDGKKKDPPGPPPVQPKDKKGDNKPPKGDKKPGN